MCGLLDHEIADDGQPSDQRTVDGEPVEFSPFNDVYHEFAGQTADYERSSESGEQGCGPDALGGQFSAHQIENHFAQDRCQHHQEGELGHALLAVAQDQSRGDRRARARQTRPVWRPPAQTDDEGVAVGDGFLVAGFGVVGESQQYGRDQQHRSDQQQDPVVGKILDQRLEERLQREAHDDHRDPSKG